MAEFCATPVQASGFAESVNGICDKSRARTCTYCATPVKALTRKCESLYTPVLQRRLQQQLLVATHDSPSCPSPQQPQTSPSCPSRLPCSQDVMRVVFIHMSVSCGNAPIRCCTGKVNEEGGFTSLAVVQLSLICAVSYCFARPSTPISASYLLMAVPPSR